MLGWENRHNVSRSAIASKNEFLTLLPWKKVPKLKEGTMPRREYVPSPIDTLSPEARSERMSLVKGRDTKPERRVREILKKLGYRYRLQYSKLPGKPDFAFPGKRKAIWVHGCFWHRHENCSLARLPKGRQDFWVPKLEGNKKRDLEHQERAQEMRWQLLVIWECELRNLTSVECKIIKFLENDEVY
jgi:DNA mismatch endonuclease (patch repair protein)